MERLSLADFKGKYVLLDFWATWCGPCVAEAPHLKAVQEAFGKDPRFVMVSLSLDYDVASPRAFVAANGLNWPQGFLGDWNKTKVPGLYQVAGIPATFLISPDGKVIAKDLRGDRMKQEVGKALAR